MARAIQVAKNGLGTARPNPMVGCVIVHNNVIIGEGFTSPYGGAHAEVNAINSVRDSTLLSSASLYVTLEPCTHHGKTPPCVDFILSKKISKVVIGLLDPNPLVAGKGIEKLKQAKCEVQVNVMEKECREHHKRFLSYYIKKRPYVILKWAETSDGFVAPTKNKRKNNAEPFWISNANSKQLVHQWRAEEHAILVGTATALADNPKLTARNWSGANPIRVAIDRQLKIPKTYSLFDGGVTTLIITEVEDSAKYIKGINYKVIDFSKNFVPQLLHKLYEFGITSLLIEGGTQTLQSFIDSDIWDEARVIKAPVSFGEGLKAPDFNGTVIQTKQINSNTLTIYKHD